MRPCILLIRYATVRRFHFTYKLHKKLRSHGIVSGCVVFVRNRHGENHRQFWANESIIVFCSVVSVCVCVYGWLSSLQKSKKEEYTIMKWLYGKRIERDLPTRIWNVITNTRTMRHPSDVICIYMFCAFRVRTFEHNVRHECRWHFHAFCRTMCFTSERVHTGHNGITVSSCYR